MKLITKVICVLRSAIAKVWRFGKISRPAHLAAFSPCGATDFYRFGINNEEILTAVNFQGNPLAYGFTQPCRFLPTVIELSAWYKIWNFFLVFLQFVLKKPVLTVYCSLYSKSQFSLSMLSDSAANDNATTSRSENLGTGPRRTIFPWALTRLWENCLHISSILTNFVYKLCIRWF